MCSLAGSRRGVAPEAKSSRGIRLRVALSVIERRRPLLLALSDQGIVSVCSFVTSLIIGRVCGKSELGSYALALTVITLTTDVSGMLVTTPYTVFSPRLSGIELRSYLGSTIAFQAVLTAGVALCLGGVAATGLADQWFHLSLSGTLLATAVVLVWIGLRDCARRVSLARLNVGRALAIDLMAAAAQVGGVSILAYFGRLNASLAVVVIGAASGVAGVAWLIAERSRYDISLVTLRAHAVENWRFGQWVLGSGLVSLLARYIYPWVLAALRGAAITGTWAACSSVVALGNPVVLGLGSYVLPKIANTLRESGVAAMRREVRYCSVAFFALLCPVLAILAREGDRAIIALYGPAYQGNADVLLMLALNMVIGAVAFPYSQGLFALGLARLDTLVNVVWVLVLFLAVVPAVRSSGAAGAAAALLLSSACATLLRVWVLEARVSQRTPHVSDAMAATSE